MELVAIDVVGMVSFHSEDRLTGPLSPCLTRWNPTRSCSSLALRFVTDMPMTCGPKARY